MYSTLDSALCTPLWTPLYILHSKLYISLTLLSLALQYYGYVTYVYEVYVCVCVWVLDGLGTWTNVYIISAISPVDRNNKTYTTVFALVPFIRPYIDKVLRITVLLRPVNSYNLVLFISCIYRAVNIVQVFPNIMTLSSLYIYIRHNSQGSVRAANTIQSTYISISWK